VWGRRGIGGKDGTYGRGEFHLEIKKLTGYTHSEEKKKGPKAGKYEKFESREEGKVTGRVFAQEQAQSIPAK